MVMKTKENGEAADADKNQEKSLSASEQPSDSEGDRTTSSAFDPTGSGAPADVEVGAPSQLLKDPAGGPNKPLPICLSFNRVPQAAATVDPKPEPEPEPSSHVPRRRRGRPRKQPLPPVGNDDKSVVVEETKKSEKMEVTETGSDVAETPAPVKRGRGRPPKKSKLCSPDAQAGSSPSKSSKDSPARLSCDSKNQNANAEALLGDINAPRPLTRGSLGKDFPSAKKRSWIDIEKDLDPDVESE